jgi:PIN domain nuclease of toxin-antitoxin system
VTAPRRKARSRRIPATGSAQFLWKAAARASYDGALLLDTHAWVWMLNGDMSRVSRAAARLIERVNAASMLFVCDISFWEVALKAVKGQLTLAVDAAVWLDRASHAPGIRYVPLDRNVLVQSTRLRGKPHGDPVDRMLLATAQIHGMPLVTVDAEIIAYAASEPGVPVCDAR